MLSYRDLIPKDVYINQRFLVVAFDGLIQQYRSSPIGEGLNELKNKIMEAPCGQTVAEVIADSEALLRKFEERLGNATIRNRYYSSVNFGGQPATPTNVTFLTIVKRLNLAYGKVTLIPKLRQKTADFYVDGKAIFDSDTIHTEAALHIFEFADSLAYQIQVKKNVTRSFAIHIRKSLPEEKLPKVSIITGDGLYQLNDENKEYQLILSTDELNKLGFDFEFNICMLSEPYASIKHTLIRGEKLAELDKAIKNRGGIANEKNDEYGALEINEVLNEILDPVFLGMPLENEEFYQDILSRSRKWYPKSELYEAYPEKLNPKTGFFETVADELFGHCVLMQDFLCRRLEDIRNMKLFELEKMTKKAINQTQTKNHTSTTSTMSPKSPSGVTDSSEEEWQHLSDSDSRTTHRI